MKSFILNAVLAAIIVCNDAALPNVVDLSQKQDFVYRKDIDMYQRGNVRLGDIMFLEHTSNLPGSPNRVQIEDVSYRGNSTTNITGVRMRAPPSPPGHVALGPFHLPHMTVRLTAAPGDGLFTTVQIWGYHNNAV